MKNMTSGRSDAGEGNDQEEEKKRRTSSMHYAVMLINICLCVCSRLSRRKKMNTKDLRLSDFIYDSSFVSI